MVSGVFWQLDDGLGPTLSRLAGFGRRLRRRDVDVGRRISVPVAPGRFGVNLKSETVVAVGKLGRDPHLAIHGERPVDLKPVDSNRLNRQAQGFTAGSKRHLGQARRRYHRLPCHRVIGQPRGDVGVEICLPDMIRAGRHLDVHPEQWVDIRDRRNRRVNLEPVVRMLPR